ncbi:MAG TPA: hypothetical protein VGI75_09915, partial [Pirellulales bacterium]
MRSTTMRFHLFSRSSLRAICIASSAAFFAAAQSADATTVDSWLLTTGGSWNSGANWSTTNIPQPTEVASIGAMAGTPNSVTLDANQTVYGVISSPGSGKST